MKRRLALLILIFSQVSWLSAGVSLGLAKAAAKRTMDLIDSVAPPPCGAPPYFNTLPLSYGAMNSIIPLGNLNPTGHVFPTDHVYMNLVNNQARSDVYAPGDVIITQVTKVDGPATPYTEYKMEFSPCRSVTGYFDHMSSLSPAILSQVSSFDYCNTYVTGGFTYTTCNKDTSIKVHAGDVLGTSGAPGQTSTGLDLGMYDTRYPLPFISPPRHPSSTLYALCPFDYFTPEVRSTLVALLGYGGTLRTIPPVCGQVNQDLAGTAQGDWFLLGNASAQEDSNLALVHDNIDPSKGVFSIGNAVGTLSSGGYTFTPISTGTVNRDFAQVSADGSVYCYNSFSRAPNGFNGRILIQMAGTASLQIQGQNGSCGAGPWTLSSPTAFER